MVVQIAQAHEIAGEGEFEDVLRAVGAGLEQADGALFDAVDVAAWLALVEQHLTGCEGAISVGRSGAFGGGTRGFETGMI